MAEFSLVQSQYHDVYPFISASSGLANASTSRSVLVVGAGSGIGKAAAVAFAQTGATNVIIAGRRVANLQVVKDLVNSSFPKTNVLAVPCDAADTASVDKLFAEIAAADITLDVLVNSQGTVRSKASLRNSDPEEWWADWQVMVKSPYLTTRAFLRSLAIPEERPATPTRAIVNLSSIGSNLILPEATSYGAPKTALNRLTEYAAAEATRLGVQVIAYHPGGVADTDITSLSADFMKAFYVDTPELAALTAVYLSTPKASYLSGRYVDATWNLEELEQFKEKILKEDLLKTAVLGESRRKMPQQIQDMVEQL
ncbi:uncharacterized protein HMPREF1541_03897 [Cyphellophora europaea CBS 101466]|uniref:Uncharacterized protein n=1 Tax=Cyphellophora europaea (strain CBS 101466) TaxID=1220924 RepID=W2S1P2_CYPE1|nr:uncharacterized protein HMPREF1541_03897 [Cyphellophora europaea CBS 101466]ETN41958.1 hypothetical protein HMPREF1541_03897 [Cyphellophora europaea CBS 101466]